MIDSNERTNKQSRGRRSYYHFMRFLFYTTMAIAGSLQSSFGASKLLTLEDVKKISPHAKIELAQELADASADFKKYGINTRLRMAHFVAQVMTETGGLKRLDENMNYSFETLIRVFSRRTINESKAREIAGKPKLIANWVYGARLGNLGRDTTDGWDYRGSGYIQLTGRENFRNRGREINLPLESDPSLARQPREGLIAALAYWEARKVNKASDDNDRRRVRVLVNGPAAHALKVSNIWFNRAWKRVFRAKAALGFESEALLAEIGSVDEDKLFDDLLKESGVIPKDLPANESGKATREESIRAFQRELNLPETGVLDEATREELLDPREWRHHDDMDASNTIPQTDPEGSVSFSLLSRTSNESSGVLLMPSTGTGETEENPTMSREIQSAFEDASSIYAQYEMGAMRSAPERFVPFSVIGDDDRVAVTNTTTFPDRAIVQILFDTGVGTSLCSGAMVSADTVLTAAHCIHSGTSTGYMYSNYRVIPGRNKGATPFGQCNAIKAHLLNGWTSSLTSLEARYYDLGALKLNCKIGDRTGWLGVEAIDESDIGMTTLVQGYAADKAPPGRQWSSIDKLRILWETKGFYDNDTYGGTSGSPVFVSESRDTITGIHTNGIHGEEPWASHNAFTRITPERLRHIAEWTLD